MFIGFDNKESMARDFSGTRWNGGSDEDKKRILKELETANILIAWYGYGNYEGFSFVLFEKDGKLYENNASHCSCYGLEGQWQPEETTWKALDWILTKGDKFNDSENYSDENSKNKALYELVKKNVQN